MPVEHSPRKTRSSSVPKQNDNILREDLSTTNVGLTNNTKESEATEERDVPNMNISSLHLDSDPNGKKDEPSNLGEPALPSQTNRLEDCASIMSDKGQAILTAMLDNHDQGIVTTMLEGLLQRYKPPSESENAEKTTGLIFHQENQPKFNSTVICHTEQQGRLDDKNLSPNDSDRERLGFNSIGVGV